MDTFKRNGLLVMFPSGPFCMHGLRQGRCSLHRPDPRLSARLELTWPARGVLHGSPRQPQKRDRDAAQGQEGEGRGGGDPGPA
eukprot:87725-Alexandrium_andersonii.AAC.1